MTVANNPGRKQAAPALFQLLSDSALSRAALAACGFPVALVDATVSGKPLNYVNPAFEEFFGFRSDEVLGRPVITLLFPQDHAAAQLFEVAPTRAVMRARRRDGASVQVELSVGMVHGADGRLTHWVLAFADRSELERLREELRLLKSLAAAP
jgi:PAS domain S-box-containing protein